MTTSGSAGKQSPSFTQNQQDKYIGHQGSKRPARSTPDLCLSAAQPVLPAMDRSASGHPKVLHVAVSPRTSARFPFSSQNPPSKDLSLLCFLAVLCISPPASRSISSTHS